MGNEASKAARDNRTDATPTNIRQMTRVALVIVSLLVIMVATFNAVYAEVFTQVGTLTLKTGENLLGTAVVDSVNGYAYFGTQTSPGMIVKVRLSDFSEVGTLPLQSGENVIASGVIDPISGYAYFGTAKFGSAGIIVKIRLSDFTEVAALNTSLPELSSALIDSASGFAYFGTNSHVLLNPDNVVKIRLSDFTENKTLTLKPGENGLNSAVIDAVNGFAYFGTAIGGPPVTVAKIRLSDLSEVGDLTLNTVAGLDSAVIDSLNGYAYFGSETPPGVIVKVRLSDLTEVSDLTLNTGEERLGSAVIDSANGFAYFGTLTTPGIVVKVRLSDFTEVGALNTGEGELSSAAIDSLNGFAYFGTFTSPGVIAKVETAAFDYALSSSGMISVHQGGSGSALVTATLTSSPAQPVTLQCVSSTLPTGASCSFNPATITPTPTGAASQLTLHTASSTPTGSFQVKVVGSPPGATTTEASTTVTLVVVAPSFSTISCGHNESCSVLSNATRLENIRLAGNTLHVEADGPHGELSYANVSIPKSEIPQIDQLHVFVDGNKLEASAVIITSNSTAYFVYFSFTFHSPVMIDIQLTAPQHTPNAPTILGMDPTFFYEIVGGVTAVAVIIVVAALVLRRQRSRITPRDQLSAGKTALAIGVWFSSPCPRIR